MNKFVKSLIILPIVLFLGCDDTSKKEKGFVYNLFKTEYYWAEHTPDIDPSSYTSIDQLIKDLRYKPTDKWSGRITKQQYENQFVNKRDSGFGFGFNSDFRVIKTRIDSPSDRGGLRRGDIITQINNQNITLKILSATAKNTNIPAKFKILRDGNKKTINITPREYNYKVSSSKIISYNNKQIGYLRFDSFLGNAVEELKGHFKGFVQNDIDELIIDLRYNGGGAVATASILLEHITKDYPGELQMYNSWNENFTYQDIKYLFEDASEHNQDELSMKKVYFLVTKNTASASEAIINALIPYLGKDNIVLVGSKTHGKAVGMQGRNYGNNIYFLINFILKNNDNNVVPFSGIEVTCKAKDDITHDFGDKNETMLNTALYHIETGMCK